eukprot:41398_1
MSSQPLKQATKPPKSYGSTDTLLPIQNGEPGAAKPKPPHKKKKEVKSMKHFCQWLKKDPWTKLNAIYFVISLIIPFIFAFCYFELNEQSTAYIFAGIYGMGTALYGMNHFRLLMSLRGEVDGVQENNKWFREQHNAINIEVNKLEECIPKLKATQHNLQESNAKFLDQIQKFGTLQKAMKDCDKKNLKELTQLGEKTNSMNEKYSRALLTQQKTILTRAFEHVERKRIDTIGFTKEEYDIFVDLLPVEYQTRFKRMGGFERLLEFCDAGDNEYIDDRKFRKALVVYAEMYVKNKDIEFKITRQNGGLIVRKFPH